MCGVLNERQVTLQPVTAVSSFPIVPGIGVKSTINKLPTAMAHRRKINWASPHIPSAKSWRVCKLWGRNITTQKKGKKINGSTLFTSTALSSLHLSPPCLPPPPPRKGGQGCLMSPPVRNLGPVIWFHTTISSLVFLPSPVTLSVFFFSACWPTPDFFFRKIFNIFR